MDAEEDDVVTKLKHRGAIFIGQLTPFKAKRLMKKCIARFPLCQQAEGNERAVVAGAVAFVPGIKGQVDIWEFQVAASTISHNNFVKDGSGGYLLAVLKRFHDEFEDQGILLIPNSDNTPVGLYPTGQMIPKYALTYSRNPTEYDKRRQVYDVVMSAFQGLGVRYNNKELPCSSTTKKSTGMQRNTA